MLTLPLIPEASLTAVREPNPRVDLPLGLGMGRQIITCFCETVKMSLYV